VPHRIPRLEEALIHARLILGMVRHVQETYAPFRRFGADLEVEIVGLAVFLGHAESRPMGLSKLADFLQMPRATVLRKLDLLMKLGLVEKMGRSYLFKASAFTTSASQALPDRLTRMIHDASKKLSVLDTKPLKDPPAD
jgi:hypothetical protein